MKLFSMLPNTDIKRVYDLCDMYLDNFEGFQSDDDVSLGDSNDDQEDYESVKSASVKMMPEKRTLKKQKTKNNKVPGGGAAVISVSDVDEEDREEAKEVNGVKIDQYQS